MYNMMIKKHICYNRGMHFYLFWLLRLLGYILKRNFRLIVILFVLIGTINAEAYCDNPSSENTRKLSFALNLLPPESPPNQPVLVQPADNSTGCIHIALSSGCCQRY